MPIIPIPYHFSTTITQKDLFINRKNDIGKIVRALSGFQMNNISVIGERKIGKSSLLYYISKYEELPDIKTVFFDFQNKAEAKIFYEQICSEQITDSSQKIAYFLDELESASSFGETFFKKLRSVANKPNIALVTASRAPLSTICPEFSDDSSPFYNIFVPQSLTNFSKEDTIELITETPKRVGLKLKPEQFFTHDEIRLIVKLSNCHPWKIQLYSYYFFEAKVNNIIEKNEVKLQIREALKMQSGQKELLPVLNSDIDIREVLSTDVSPLIKNLFQFLIEIATEYATKKYIG